MKDVVFHEFLQEWVTEDWSEDEDVLVINELALLNSEEMRQWAIRELDQEELEAKQKLLAFDEMDVQRAIREGREMYNRMFHTRRQRSVNMARYEELAQQLERLPRAAAYGSVFPRDYSDDSYSHDVQTEREERLERRLLAQAGTNQTIQSWQERRERKKEKARLAGRPLRERKDDRLDLRKKLVPPQVKAFFEQKHVRLAGWPVPTKGSRLAPRRRIVLPLGKAVPRTKMSIQHQHHDYCQRGSALDPSLRKAYADVLRKHRRLLRTMQPLRGADSPPQSKRQKVSHSHGVGTAE